MQQHLCHDDFWGYWTDDLLQILYRIAPGDVLNMEAATYQTLCALQREIEYATGVRQTEIPDHMGKGTGFTEEDEVLLRTVAQQFLAELSLDQFDNVPVPLPHNQNTLAWMVTSGTAQTTPVNAIGVLLGGEVGIPPDGVLGRIRAALGS
jgi:hypothetical protein